MPQTTFRFKQFSIEQDRTAMKVGTDGVLLGAWAGLSQTGNILDIGTGTGVIALIAAQRTNAAVIALEPDNDSFQQATENFIRSKWNNRIISVRTSLQEYTENTSLKFDSIVSNPPFHEENVLSDDERKNIARHSDSLPVNIIINSSAALLAENGSSSLIYPCHHLEEIKNQIKHSGLYLQRLTYVRPIPGKDSHRILVQFGKVKTEITESEITIEDGRRHHYTAEYKKLTEPFYLYFKY